MNNNSNISNILQIYCIRGIYHIISYHIICMYVCMKTLDDYIERVDRAYATTLTQQTKTKAKVVKIESMYKTYKQNQKKPKKKKKNDNQIYIF